MNDRRGRRPSPAPAPVRAQLAGVTDRLIKLDEVQQIAGLGKTMIYAKMKQGTFPKACKPGGTGSRWSEREVNAWLEQQLAARAA